MCDLFALCAGSDYAAPKSLPLFASRAKNNMDGWGIGYFKKGRALVEKSAKGVYAAGHIHDSFERLARLVRSRIIISHVRFQTSGPVDDCHAHPFILRFWDHDWLFAHNGKAPAIESYRSSGIPVEGALSDSARTFEFLRDQMLRHHQAAPVAAGLFEALRQSTAKLLHHYPGHYNYLLTNGLVLFAFTNHRQFMLLKGSKKLEGALLVTTVGRGLSDENWIRIARSTSRHGLLLMISGTELIMQEAI